MKRRGKIAKAIDYRIPASRLKHRSHTTKSNIMAIGAAVAIVLGLLVYGFSVA